jgi:hypothetical protein
MKYPLEQPSSANMRYVKLDRDNNIYYVAYNDWRHIYKLDKQGVKTTFNLDDMLPSIDFTTHHHANFHPLTFNDDNELIFTIYNRIYKLPQGSEVPTLIAGGGENGTANDGELALGSTLGDLSNIAMNSKNEMHFLENATLLRKIDKNGRLVTLFDFETIKHRSTYGNYVSFDFGPDDEIYFSAARDLYVLQNGKLTKLFSSHSQNSECGVGTIKHQTTGDISSLVQASLSNLCAGTVSLITTKNLCHDKNPQKRVFRLAFAQSFVQNGSNVIELVKQCN